jgi:trimethylamine--corrinoid protein Co-methyltransferase
MSGSANSGTITGRRATPRRRNASDIVQTTWGQSLNWFPSVESIIAEEVELIHASALQILEEIGIRCPVKEAQDWFARAGAIVDPSSGSIRVGREIIEAALATVPSGFRLLPRSAERAVRLERGQIATAAVMGSPNCADLVRGRRSGSMRDFSELLQLTQFFNSVHMNGWPVEPLDIEVRYRHLDAALAMLTLTDKVPYVACQSKQRIEDVLTLCAMARGETLDEFSRTPGVFSIINTNTPLQFDIPMTVGIIEMAKHRQPVLITPFIMAGASTPATIAGAMTLNVAEVLFGVTLGQLVRPGAPAVFGCAAMNIDMKTGAPAMGFPDMHRCTLIGGQLANRYRMPMRSSNFCSPNLPDFISGVESTASVFSALMAGANLIMHAAGWMENGLCTSYEKFVLDCEILQMAGRVLERADISADSISLDEIKSTGVGGHFFGTDRTIATFETAFYRPLISSTQNYGAWVEGGGKSASERATRVWQEALRQYEMPPIAPGRLEAMIEFVARRKSEGGAPLDG